MDSNKDIFMKLIKEFAKDGQISEMEMMILKEKASAYGIDESSLNVLLEIELDGVSNTPNPQKESFSSGALNTADDHQRQESGGINKLQMLELFIKEMARDGKIDDDEVAAIKEKAKELKISHLIAEEILASVKGNLIEKKTLRVEYWSGIFGAKYFEIEEKILKLKENNLTNANQLKQLRTGEYEFYQYIGEYYNFSKEIDLYDDAKYFAESVLDEKLKHSRITPDQADDLIEMIDTKYDLNKNNPKGVTYSRLLSFMADEDDKKWEKTNATQVRLKNNLSILNKKINEREKAITNEMNNDEIELKSLNAFINTMKGNKEINCGISLVTNECQIDFKPEENEVEYIELKKDGSLVIKTKNILYQFELSFEYDNGLEKELKFHFGSKVK